MSVTTTLNKVIYTGNGVASEFAFTYKVTAQTDLVVTKYTIADGTLDVLTLTTDYTIALTDSGASGGAVTLVAGALSSSYKLIIERILTINQSTDYVDNAAFSPETIETSLDKLTMICQQLKEQLDRLVLGSIDAEDGTVYIAPDYDVPAITAGDSKKLLRAKATEDGYELKSMADVVDIDGLSAKTTVVNADVIMIEDSEDSDAKKKVATNNIISINAQTAKTSLAATDVVLIEDSAASYVKKKVAASLFALREVHTATGSFTAPVGVTRVYVTMCGAGGGGGGGDVGAEAGGGGGGGAGGVCVKAPYTVVAGNAYAVTINAAGTGGAAGANGTNGGTTVFNDAETDGNLELICGGGSAGVGASDAAGAGGAGGINAPVDGSATGGMPSMNGQDGADGGAAAGGGGGGALGRGGSGGSGGSVVGSVPVAGSYGGGGGGGGNDVAGAAGSTGICIIEW